MSPLQGPHGPPLLPPPHFAPAGCRWLGAPPGVSQVRGGSGVPCAARTHGRVGWGGAAPCPSDHLGGPGGGQDPVSPPPPSSRGVPAPPVPRARPPEPCQQLGARGNPCGFPGQGWGAGQEAIGGGDPAPPTPTVPGGPVACTGVLSGSASHKGCWRQAGVSRGVPSLRRCPGLRDAPGGGSGGSPVLPQCGLFSPAPGQAETGPGGPRLPHAQGEGQGAGAGPQPQE